MVELRVVEKVARPRGKSHGTAERDQLFDQFLGRVAKGDLGDDGAKNVIGRSALVVGGVFGRQQIGPAERIAEQLPLLVRGDADEDLAPVGFITSTIAFIAVTSLTFGLRSRPWLVIGPVGFSAVAYALFHEVFHVRLPPDWFWRFL